MEIYSMYKQKNNFAQNFEPYVFKKILYNFKNTPVKVQFCIPCIDKPVTNQFYSNKSFITICQYYKAHYLSKIFPSVRRAYNTKNSHLKQGRYITRTTIVIFSFCIGLVTQLSGPALGVLKHHCIIKRIRELLIGNSRFLIYNSLNQLLYYTI